MLLFYSQTALQCAKCNFLSPEFSNTEPLQITETQFKYRLMYFHSIHVNAAASLDKVCRVSG